MNENDKELLLKDLCARLPYSVKVLYENEIFDVEYVCPMYEEIKLDNYETWTLNIEEVKPYLFPMSSMTEEQYKTYCELEDSGNMEHLSLPLFDWLNENHFDYRGLIEKGLAIDATKLSVY